MSKTALIIVDVQNDFLPGGALAVPDGDQVIEPLLSWVPKVDVLVYTRDIHPPDHCSFSDDPKFEDGSWPAHCVENTNGAAGNMTLAEAALDFPGRCILINKGDDPNKEAYSGFEGTVGALAPAYNDDPDVTMFTFQGDYLATALILSQVTHVVVGGLALDYCVKATAIDAAKLGFQTDVAMLATRPVSLLTAATALREMVDAGVNIL